MKKLIILMICMFLLPMSFAFTSIQYQGCGFGSHESPNEIEEQERITVDRGVQYYSHYEPCMKSFSRQSASLFRESSQIQKSSYVTCERVQGTNDYSCDRTDLRDELFENPRLNTFSFSTKFDKGFY